MCHGRHTMCMAAGVQAPDVQKSRSVWMKTCCVCDVLLKAIGLITYS